MTQLDATPEAIMAEMKLILTDTFEVDADDIQPTSDLFEDLGLDSIDAVDLVILFGQKLDKQLDQEAFQSIRTVEEAVEAIHKAAVEG